MTNILLNDILHLTEEEIKHSKIALNMKYGGKSHFDRWNESDPNNRDVSYSYSAYYTGKQRNFTFIGQKVYGFVQLPTSNKRWLFVTAGVIKDIPKKGPCSYETIESLRGFFGRLIIELPKGNTNSRYIFNLSKYINQAVVIEILENEYQALRFEGLDNVHLSFHDLMLVLKSEKYADFRSALSSVKGIYCLSDKKTGKLYIGSAYGSRGVAQRWQEYLDTRTGGNAELIKLQATQGNDYFEKNFEFTLIEFFSMNQDTGKIIERETYWKNAFLTKETGYNDN